VWTKTTFSEKNLNFRKEFEKMADQNVQHPKKRTVKELNIYVEALDVRLKQMEKIVLALNVDPQAIEDNLKTEVDNTNKIVKIDKRINVIDKKVKAIEAHKSENKEKLKIKCKVFPDNTVLKEHILKQHPVVIECRFCAETFQQTWMLEMHIKSHTEKKVHL
jgi:predicted RNase H-like nuclease (RuvC/YqgF family)